MPSEEGGRKKNVFKREIKKKSEEADGEKEEEDDAEEIEIDIASHGERPSVRAKLSMAAKAGISNRPRLPLEPPCLYRIYQATSQRVPLELSQLNSAAAFLLICDDDNRVLIWLGSNCPDSDITFAKEMALEVYRRDMRNYDSTEIDEIVWEGRESERPALLKILLDECGSDEGTYRGKKTIAERKNEIENQPFCMSIMQKMPGGRFELLEIGYATPNEFGTIGRIPFSPIEVDTIVLTSVENQWDLWIARGNTQEDEAAVLEYVTSIAAARAGITTANARQNIRIMRQGCERVTYRRYFKVLTDFEPPGRTIPWVTNILKKKPEKSNARPAVSKRFALDNEKEDDYGAPMMDAGYDFISGIFGGMDPFRSSPSVEPPIKSQNSVESRSIGEEQKSNHKEVIEIRITDDEGTGGGVGSGSEKYRSEGEGSLQYVDETDVYDIEAEGIEIQSPSPAPSPIITKLTEGRASLTKPMLVFLEAEQISPERRLKLLSDASVNPNLLIGWQVDPRSLSLLLSLKYSFTFLFFIFSH
jgi:hypothetical protein